MDFIALSNIVQISKFVVIKLEWLAARERPEMTRKLHTADGGSALYVSDWAAPLI